MKSESDFDTSGMKNTYGTNPSIATSSQKRPNLSVKCYTRGDTDLINKFEETNSTFFTILSVLSKSSVFSSIFSSIISALIKSVGNNCELFSI